MANIYRLGIISDTHLEDMPTAIAVAQRLLEGPFAQVDAILHAGDMLIAELESCFDGIPFYAVQGNMDVSRPGLPLKRILNIADFRVGLIHGWGSPAMVPVNVLNEFKQDNLDLIIFGHSHTPYLKYSGHTLLFNPGSATDHRGNAEVCTVGVVDFGEDIEARHLSFKGVSEI